jgi:hypothetical protein
MGRIAIPKLVRSPVFDLEMKWDRVSGVLTVSGLAKSRTIEMNVNGQSVNLPTDVNGVGELSFEKSDPPVLYKVRIQSPIGFTKDKRIGFLY